MRKRRRRPLNKHQKDAAHRITGGRFCFWCGTIRGPFQYDHVLAVADGGDNEPPNVVLACAPCNQSKGTNFLPRWVSEQYGGTGVIDFTLYVMFRLHGELPPHLPHSIPCVEEGL